jgi:hypothetical protein
VGVDAGIVWPGKVSDFRRQNAVVIDGIALRSKIRC